MKKFKTPKDVGFKPHSKTLDVILTVILSSTDDKETLDLIHATEGRGTSEKIRNCLREYTKMKKHA